MVLAHDLQFGAEAPSSGWGPPIQRPRQLANEGTVKFDLLIIHF